MEKRGLSAVVTSLILILLVLVAVGVVWVVIRNLIEEGTEEISLGKLTVDLEIKEVRFDVAEGKVFVKVKRNQGVGELSKINFVLSDGVNEDVVEKETTLQELGEKTFEIDLSETDLSFVESVKIAPVLKSESGKDIPGDVVDEYEISSEEILESVKNMNGLISWWRFENNVEDEVGDNDGTLNGATYTQAGKLSGAYGFDGDDEISIVSSDSLNSINNMGTISFWAYANVWEGYPILFRKGNSGGWCSNGADSLHIFRHINSNIYLSACYPLPLTSDFRPYFPEPQIEEWHYYTFTWDGSISLAYLDGVPSSHTSEQVASIRMDNEAYGIGTSFNGKIDEVMMFNRALTPQEIQAIYNLKL